MIRKVVVFSVIIWNCGLCRSHAELITYTEAVVGSGSLGGQNFAGEMVTVSLTADTSGITNEGTFFATTPATTTLTIAGIGTAIFTDSVFFLNSPTTGTSQFFDFTGTGFTPILGITAAELTGYDLASAIGPVTGSAFNGGESLPTTLGSFNLTDFDTGTFTATVQSVPEPTSIAMLGSAILIVAGLRAAKREIA